MFVFVSFLLCFLCLSVSFCPPAAVCCLRDPKYVGLSHFGSVIWGIYCFKPSDTLLRLWFWFWCPNSPHENGNRHHLSTTRLAVFFPPRYACGRPCFSRQVTECVTVVMALPALRLFPVAVLAILVTLASSSQHQEWHFNPGTLLPPNCCVLDFVL